VTINGELVSVEWFSAWAIADAVEDWMVLHRDDATRGASDVAEASL
jgi:hypothetical protein